MGIFVDEASARFGGMSFNLRYDDDGKKHIMIEHDGYPLYRLESTDEINGLHTILLELFRLNGHEEE